MSDASNHAQEIIIVKRNRGGEEGHHGGAWKIAFADFMTAMMALFLVLWLINAANEETKKAVASYFNPVKLVERNSSEKGLEEQKGGPTKDKENGGLSSNENITDKETRREQEQKFFDSPFTALAEISPKKSDRAIALAKGAGGGSGEENPSSPFADPFGPDFAGQAEALGELTQPGPNHVAAADAIAANGESMEDTTPAEPQIPVIEQAAANDFNAKADKSADSTTIDGITKDGAKAKDNAGPDDGTMTKMDEKARAEAKEKKIAETSEKLRKELTKALGAEKELSGAVTKKLEVKAVSDGVLISVTDQLGFSMFEIGSAIPLKQTVLAMDGIAKVLAAQKGQLRVYGHTDARAFATPDDDNWRLSAARAHAAYFMLVRGGVKEKRFSQIAGYADRQLKDPDNPNADVNRRIEILLEVQ